MENQKITQEVAKEVQEILEDLKCRINNIPIKINIEGVDTDEVISNTKIKSKKITKATKKYFTKISEILKS
jgi:ribosome recycling factor